jgi:hypothetical protein
MEEKHHYGRLGMWSKNRGQKAGHSGEECLEALYKHKEADQPTSHLKKWLI